MHPIDERRKELKFLIDALSKEQLHREYTKQLVYDPIEKTDNPQWILNERSLMLDRTNMIRASHHLLPVSFIEIYKAENSAKGHSDYTHKFALYCLEYGRGERE